MTEAVGYTCPRCDHRHAEIEVEPVAEGWRRTECEECEFIEYYPPPRLREVAL